MTRQEFIQNINLILIKNYKLCISSRSQSPPEISEGTNTIKLFVKKFNDSSIKLNIISEVNNSELPKTLVIKILKTKFKIILTGKGIYGKIDELSYEDLYHHAGIDLLKSLLLEKYHIDDINKKISLIKNAKEERLKEEKIAKAKKLKEKKIAKAKKLSRDIGNNKDGKVWHITRSNARKKFEDFFSCCAYETINLPSQKMLSVYDEVLPVGIKNFLDPDFFGNQFGRYGGWSASYEKHLAKIARNQQIYDDLRLIELKKRDQLSKKRIKISNSNTEEITIRKENFTKQIINADPFEFETICTTILLENGWNAKTTKKVGDGGADIVAIKDNRKVVFQCKMYTRNITETAVLDAIRGRMEYSADEAFVVGLRNNFTAKAEKWAKHDGNVKLVSWVDLLSEI